MTAQTSHKIPVKLDAEQLSTSVLYVLVALVVIVFGAFFLIGYDVPYEDDPSFNAPLLTDAVLVFMYVLVSGAVLLAVAAVAVGQRRSGGSSSVVNNIPAARIAWATVALLVGSLLVTFLLGSSKPVLVNGVEYTDTFWLKATDMFINTSFVLLFVAVCGVVFGLSGYNRKLKNVWKVNKNR